MNISIDEGFGFANPVLPPGVPGPAIPANPPPYTAPPGVVLPPPNYTARDIIQRGILGLGPYDPSYDYNNNGKLDVGDIILLARITDPQVAPPSPATPQPSNQPSNAGAMVGLVAALLLAGLALGGKK